MIEPRVEEIFALVQHVIRESGYEEVLLSSGIVITGGSAPQPGMVELARHLLKPVRRGIPKYKGHLSELVAQPRASTSWAC